MHFFRHTTYIIVVQRYFNVSKLQLIYADRRLLLFEGGMVRAGFVFYLFVLFQQSLFGDHMTLFKPYIATSYPMKQQELATKARTITGAAPLYKALGPSVFIKCVKTSPTPLNCPSVAEN